MNGRYRLNVWAVLVVLVCLLGVDLHAGIGVNAGPTFSRMDIYYYNYRHKSALTYRGSVFYSIPVVETASLEPGIAFTHEAFQYYYVRFRGWTDARINFLKLNLMVNVRIAPTRFHFIAGPYAAFRLGEENDGVTDRDEIKAENKTGWGVQMGFRYYFKKSKKTHAGLFVEVLGDIGLTRFQNEVGVFKTTYYQSRLVSFMVGYVF